jgi:AcrR family transcriptional regulator
LSTAHELPTQRGRRTHAAIDAAARAVIARKGVLATTIADIAAEAGRSTASFYNYYDSKEDMIRQWAMRFRNEASHRSLVVIEHGLSNRERAYELAASIWNSYRNRFAEMVGVSQLAMINDDFARHWTEMCALPLAYIAENVRRVQAEGHCLGDDPQLVAEAMVSMFSQFCYMQLSRDQGPDDEACVQTLANIYYRVLYGKEDHRN